MELSIKAKKLCTTVNNTSKVEVVKLKLGDDSQVQKIGNCLLEKLQNTQCQEQPKQVLANLLYDQDQGYVRLKVGKFTKQQLENQQEQVMFSDLILQHSNCCPNYQFTRLDEEFDMSSSSTASLYVSALLLDKDNNVLLIKRNHEMKSFPRCWVFPGGQVDVGESFIQTLFKQIKEDVGVNILFQEQKVDTGEFEEDFEAPSQNELSHQNKEENIFKRKTRQQTKKQDQKKKPEPVVLSRREEMITKSTVHLADDPYAICLYESVYPTDIRINYPQRCNLMLIYTIKIQESYKDIQLSQNKKNIDYSAWVPLNVLYQIVDETSIKDSEFLKQEIETGISINHNYFPIGYNCFVGPYPNELGEGIGEAYIKALRTLKIRTQLKLQLKKK